MSIPHYQLLIDGKLVDTRDRLEVLNPANEKIFATCARASEEELTLAIRGAWRAQQDWARTTISDRQALLRRISACIAGAAEELAELLVKEQGKPLAQAQLEVKLCEAFTQHFASLDVPTEVLRDTKDSRVELHRKPLGVVAAIVPWNFPLLIATYKMAPALLTGNAVIIKPAPTTPLSTCRMGELIRDVVPPGLVNILTDRNDLGPLITSHPRISKISFTGSTETGKHIAKNAASTLKRLVLELGGNDPAIVLAGANVKEAAKGIFQVSFFNSGQMCVAIKRVYVHDSIHDAFCDEMAALAKAAVVGDGMAAGTEFGPVQNAMQFAKVRQYIEGARLQGTIIAGGSVPGGPGYFIQPTIVRDLPRDSALVLEEQFGPVLPIVRYKLLDDAIRWSNDTNYGLGASVWGDPAAALAVAKQLDCGVAWINEHANGGPDVPLSPAKESGAGCEWGLEGLHEYTQSQAVYIRCTH